jgi:hypothetical protein
VALFDVVDDLADSSTPQIMALSLDSKPTADFPYVRPVSRVVLGELCNPLLPYVLFALK